MSLPFILRNKKHEICDLSPLLNDPILLAQIIIHAEVFDNSVEKPEVVEFYVKKDSFPKEGHPQLLLCYRFIHSQRPISNSAYTDYCKRIEEKYSGSYFES